MNKNPTISDNIQRYVCDVITRETPVQCRLREETARLPMAVMQTTPDQVQFLGMLVKMLGAKRLLEVGTFTGYSALAMAMALPEGGRLDACDVSQEWTDVAQRYWKEAGVANRIALHLAPAKETLANFLKQGLTGAFDVAFIDADKQAYDEYYEACLKLVRPGGVIAFDNMLWGGDVADASVQDAQTRALRDLNAKIRDDERVDCCLLTVADGIMLARKR
jgi:predicted O-methyltransferase YrrM